MNVRPISFTLDHHINGSEPISPWIRRTLRGCIAEDAGCNQLESDHTGTDVSMKKMGEAYEVHKQG